MWGRELFYFLQIFQKSLLLGAGMPKAKTSFVWDYFVDIIFFNADPDPGPDPAPKCLNRSKKNV